VLKTIEKQRAWKRAWKKRNPEKVAANARAAYAREPEKYRARSQDYRNNNPEKVRESWMRYRTSTHGAAIARAWRNSLPGLTSHWKAKWKYREKQLAAERTVIQDKLIALEKEGEECRKYLEQATRRKSSVPASNTPPSSERSGGSKTG
jgi:hypothetical protein